MTASRVGKRGNHIGLGALNAAVATISGVIAVAMLALPTVLPGQATAATADSGDVTGSASIGASASAPWRDALRPALVAATVEAVTPEIRVHKVVEGDTLRTIASFYHIRPETIAFNNGINDLSGIQIGDELRFPTTDGAIVEVRPGDTVESVADRFGADPAAIAAVNRLLYEPQNFAPGVSIIVPMSDGAFPNFEVRDTGQVRVAGVPRHLAAGAPTANPPRLSRPVNGYVTQFFHSWHLGVDLAAPYGATLGASDDGVVSATGWVPVGGLRVCVQHGGGLETCYYHTAVVYVREGQKVARGEAIAAVGLTGVTTGPHVHWEAKLHGAPVNPLAYSN